MSSPDYDSPATSEHWCNLQRNAVEDYLREQQVSHGRIGEWPAWHIAPYVSIWAVESLIAPECIGWWVITGDLPTDYISAENVEQPQHPRKAVRAIAKQWLGHVQAWEGGKESPDCKIAGPHSHQELAPLLKSRAALLLEWTNNDGLWEP